MSEVARKDSDGVTGKQAGGASGESVPLMAEADCRWIVIHSLDWRQKTRLAQEFNESTTHERPTLTLVS